MSFANSLIYCSSLLLVLSASSCKKDHSVELPLPDQRQSANEAELMLQNQEFRQEVIEVSKGIHVAIGFGLANSILLTGNDGDVIVDCLESNQSAEKVKNEFSQISKNPVKAIIYTHNHADHIFGAAVMAGKDNPQIIAHRTTNDHIDRIMSVIRPIITTRSYRMFGTYLEDNGLISRGIGSKLALDENSIISILRPTRLIDEFESINISGIEMEIIHSPGETDDQLIIWLPDRKILMPGDNIYKAFPNLYTIRGTSYRDVRKWITSLDQMRSLKPEILVPQHGRPIFGQDTIMQILTDYRDAIQYVHDQTIRNINKGLTPDELVQVVQLPTHLYNSPYLRELYGRVDWSVRSIYDGYLGFFNGNPSTLGPLTPLDRAQKMSKLSGGHENMYSELERASNENEHQWVLELSDHLSLLEYKFEEVKALRRSALLALGEKQTNPNARNYYLSSALELDGIELKSFIKPTEQTVGQTPLKAIFESLSVNLIPEKSINKNVKANWYFKDRDEWWSIHLRQGVADVQNFKLENAAIEVVCTEAVWKEIVSGIRGALASTVSGKLKVEPGMSEFKEFMDSFKE